jgi:hypothetical protein
MFTLLFLRALPMATEPISKLLDNPELRSIAERLDQIKRLQERYRTFVPENLATASRVCAIDGTIVVICAASGPVAAALRQLAPRLLSGLREAARKTSKHPRDQELTSIRIEVQVDAPAPKVPVQPRAALPHAQLERISGALADSPLKQELERIARDQARRTRPKT